MITAAANDVVVVGGGPVGLTLSILLAQRGHAVTILERQPEPYPLPRAVHFDHEVGRIFQSAGIGTELAEISEPADIYEWRNGDGTTLLRLGRVGPGPSGWPLSSMFHQPSLEAAARTASERRSAWTSAAAARSPTSASTTRSSRSPSTTEASSTAGTSSAATAPTAPSARCSGCR